MLSKHTSAGQNYTLLKENRISQVFWQADGPGESGGWGGQRWGGVEWGKAQQVFEAGPRWSWQRWLWIEYCFIAVCVRGACLCELNWEKWALQLRGSNTWLAMRKPPRQLWNMCDCLTNQSMAEDLRGRWRRSERGCSGGHGRDEPFMVSKQPYTKRITWLRIN